MLNFYFYVNTQVKHRCLLLDGETCGRLMKKQFQCNVRWKM